MQLRDAGRLDDAVEYARRAIAIQPDLVHAHNNLANILHLQGWLDEAIESYRLALRLRPDLAIIHNNLGLVLHQRGMMREAMGSLGAAISLEPAFAQAHSNLGNVLRDLGRIEEAIAEHRLALQGDSNYAEGWNNLGNALQQSGDLDGAAAAFARAVELRPNFPVALSNAGNVLKEQARIAESIGAYRKSVELAPDDARVHSNLLYAMYFDPRSTSQSIFDEHLRWAQRHAQPLSPKTPAIEVSSQDRRLRIGYVSPDFRNHPVGRFILPLLTHHDRQAFEVVCFSDFPGEDAITRQIRACPDEWHTTHGLSDAQLGELIRAQRIDILIDLSLHMAGNRMLVFARKPAPLQITYLAYAGTSGMETMDYRLTDPHLDPPGLGGGRYSERSLHLPRTYWCYSPSADAPPVQPLPWAVRGAVTFGCLNTFSKINEAVIAAWARIMNSVPHSRLVLYAPGGSHRDRTLDAFAAGGVDRGRIEFVMMRPLVEYLATYNRVDIALDPFPYNGGTTTCDVLWMGVPVVTLAGEMAVSRAGVSLLNNLALPELIATSVDEYVRIAAELAADRERLSELRRSLRDRMRTSPLCDASSFARDVEQVYRAAWKTRVAGARS